MKEEYNFYMLHFALYCGTHGRGSPGREKESAGYPHPIALLPDEVGRGQPPPGGKIDIRGREPCGTTLSPNAVRFSTLTPKEYTGQAGFTSVQTRKVRRRKEGSAGIMYVYDSCFRRRSEDLSACVASDSVWVHEEDMSVGLSPNVVLAGVHGPGRLSTLTPKEYTGQAGFTTVVNLNDRRKMEGSAGFTFVYDSWIRIRFKDLSACLPPDNVWIQERRFKDLSACEASRFIGTGSDNVWVKKRANWLAVTEPGTRNPKL